MQIRLELHRMVIVQRWRDQDPNMQGSAAMQDPEPVPAKRARGMLIHSLIGEAGTHFDTLCLIGRATRSGHDICTYLNTGRIPTDIRTIKAHLL